MENKLFMQIISKYIDTMLWLNSVTLSDIFEAEEILKSAKEHTLNTMKCTPEKFHDIIELKIFGKEDVPIIECYYSFLDNIRKAHQ